MTEAHNLTLLCLGSDFQAIGQRLPLDQERMVARGLERRGQILEQIGPAVVDRRGLPVHEPARLHDVTAKMLAQVLVPQADAKNRFFARECGHHF